MIYIIVLFGSFFGICAVLGVRVLYRNRNVRKFVRSFSHRIESEEQRGRSFMPDTKVERPKKNPRASAIAMQKARSLVREAEKSFAQKKFDEAEKCYIQALTEMPEAADIRAKLAKFYLETDRDQKAEAIYLDLIKQQADVSLQANLGLALYKQGKFEKAIMAYQAAYEGDNRNPERAAALGQAYFASGNLNEAAPLLSKAAERMARDVQLLHLLGDCYMRLKQFPDALSVYQRINVLQPYDEEVKEKVAHLSRV